jgi:NADH-quinone oxidoreductase subunit C/D
MFNWKSFEKSKAVLSHLGGASYREWLGQHHLYIRPKDLLDWVELLRDDLGFITLSDIAAKKTSESSCELVYHFLNMENHQRLNLHLSVSESEVIPSLGGFFSNAEWPEREQAELFRLKFDTIKSALLKSDEPGSMVRPDPIYNPNRSERPYSAEFYEWKHFDSFSPETDGSFELLVCFDPIKIVDSKIRIGLHHQELENKFASKDLVQILYLIDQLNISSAPTYSIAWAKTIEEMFRVKIPERAQAIRILMLELARVADHLTCLANTCLCAGEEEFRLLINAREKIYELFEKFVGTRSGTGIAKIGGVSVDLPPGWVVEYQTVAEILKKNLRIINRALISKHKFRDLLQGDLLDAQSVLQWGISGPSMRAAGLNFDLRKSQPFYFYQDIDFDIPVGIHGRAYDRYLIRYEEIFQSIRIMTQVIDNLPLGEVINPFFDGHALIVTKALKSLDQPTEWHYSCLESPSGEAGFLANFEGTLTPSRLKIKTPGFALAQAIPILIKGLTQEQLAPNIAGLGLSRWEMDR